MVRFLPLLLGAVTLVAANPTPPRFTGTPFIRTWNADDYAAAPVNWHIVQHPQTGFIYVGNNFGLLEFDGAAWRLYPLPGDGAARTIAIDAAGTVWSGGVGRVAALRPGAAGALRSADETGRIPAGPTALGDFNFSLAAPDGVYFATVRTLVRFTPDQAAQRWEIPGRATGLFWHDGALHISAGGDGILRLGPRGLVPAAPAPSDSQGPGHFSLRVLAARADGDGACLLLTTRGPFRWRGAGHAPEPLSAGSGGYFADEAATAAAFLPAGRLAFSSLRQGLVFLDAHGQLLSRLDQDHGLPSNRIEEIATDREGGLWVAQRTGLARLQFDSGFALHGPALGISGSPRALARFQDRLYIAHNEGAAWRDDTTGRMTPVRGIVAGLNTLFEADGRLFGTGTDLYEVTSDDRARSLLPLSLTSIHRLKRHPTFFVGGSPSGAWLLAFERGTWRTLGPLTQVSGGLTRFREDDDGSVWAMGYDGLGAWRLDFSQRAAVDVPARRYDAARGLPPVRRRDSARLVALNDRLYATCALWTRRYDRLSDRFAPLAADELLPGDAGAAAAHTDSTGVQWWFLDRPEARLLRLGPGADGQFTTREIPLGPLRRTVPNSLFFDEPTRTLWVAAQGTLVSLDPDWTPSVSRPPLRALVRTVHRADGELLVAPGPGLVGAGAFPLRSADRALRIDFAAPAFEGDYYGKTTTLYRTRLVGLEDDWTAWSEEASRAFTNLPYRTFAFEVQARALDGRTSPPASFSFAIPPPWWLTPWAFAGGAALALGAALGLVQLRTRLLRRQALQLETVVAQRTAELERLRQIDRDENVAARLAEEKARLEVLRYQLNPHFLFNALASVRSQLPATLVAPRTAIERITDFCQLTLFRRPDDTFPKLREEMDLLRAYLDIEQARWGSLLVVDLRLEPGAEARAIPPLLLLPLVENALKYGRATGRGTLRIRLVATLETPHTLALEIANTGTWVDGPARTATPSLGIGLENVRQRLARHYPGRHTFVTAASAEWVVATLRLQGDPAVPTGGPAARAAATS